MKNVFQAVIGLLFCSVSMAVYAQSVAPTCVENTRECMIAAATAYLDGITTHNGSDVPLAPNVRRTSNPAQGDPGVTIGEDAVRDTLTYEPDMSGHSNDRFFVDERTNNVVAFTLLHLTGKKRDPDRVTFTDGKESVAVTVHLVERFKVVDGLITEIEAIHYDDIGNFSGISNWPDSPN